MILALPSSLWEKGVTLQRWPKLQTIPGPEIRSPATLGNPRPILGLTQGSSTMPGGPGRGLTPKLHGIATACVLSLWGPIMQHGISR